MHWMQSIKSNEKCLGNERERINLWFLQFNKLLELWMYVVNVLFETTKCNQIKVLGCTNVHTRTYFVCILVALRCIWMSELSQTSVHFLGRLKLDWVSSIHLKSSRWKVMFKCVCVWVHYKRKGYKFLWWTAQQQYLNQLSAFVHRTYTKAYAHTHTARTHNE